MGALQDKNTTNKVGPIRQPRPDRELGNRMICASIERNATRPLTHIVTEFGISVQVVRDILKKNDYKPFKLKRSNELWPDDTYRRMEFCERLMEMSHRDENLISNSIFSDESSFPLHGRHNPSICHYWSLG
ncbi:hypothetical protein ABEB36_014514 [Hypothenemus hampei]|uniref:Uncharacterized protein n=1 Tax=Hypothenemus hampei TaxID=57062 RepID=A0ABD1E2B0_HYPHA